ncbi:MAG: ABC transporter permease [Anaerolineales bacterium]|nr:ABC transporter permease [Anaerolineales bacterium]
MSNDINERYESALRYAAAALKAGLPTEARRMALRALEWRADRYEAWLVLAALAEPRAGLAYARKAQEIEPDNERVSQAVAWFEERLPGEVPEAPVDSGWIAAPAQLVKDGLETLSAPRGALWKDAWRGFKRHRAAVASLVILLLFFFMAIFAPLITPYDPDVASFEHIREEPMTRFEPDQERLEACHWYGTPLEERGCTIFLAGTDRVGRDLYSRTVYASRTSLSVALVASAVSVLIGISYGTIAGYEGGRIDEAMMRFVDFLYSLPVFLIVLGIQSFFRLWYVEKEGVLGVLEVLNRQTGGLLFLFIAIGAVNWVGMARLSRAMVHSQKANDYIEAAKSIGANEVQIIVHHLLPNIIGPLLVMETISIPGYIFLEATLSFIGLGVLTSQRGGSAAKDLPSWGTMIREGYPGLRTSPYLILLPSIALTILTLAFNFLGDGLRDVIDPRTRKKKR